MKRWLSRLLIAPLLCAVASCRPTAETPPPKPRNQTSSAASEGKALLEQGQVDLALEKLAQSPSDAEALYYLGMAWAKKAESAPLPTPAPAPMPLPHGAAPPVAPEFKNEELQALQAFQRSITAAPTQARAHLAMAELLAPHAIRVHEAEEARRRPVAKRGKGAAPVEATSSVSQGEDFSPDRVIRAYQMAVRNDPESARTVESLIGFATRVGRLDAAEDGLRELVRREKEKPAAPLIRYGDFLAKDKKDPAAAVEQYSQALIWQADDDEVRGKIADIYMAWGAENLAKGEFSAAEVRFKSAQKYITDRSSPRGVRLQDYISQIRAVRDGR